MPDWKREIRNRLTSLQIEPAREAGIIEEFAEHLEDRYQELLSGGVDETAARKIVMRELESAEFLPDALPARERAPRPEPVPQGETSSGNPFADFGRDLRYGLRALCKTPLFTFVAVLTLALGIGANTTVFTIINSLLLHPLPVTEPSRLVAVCGTQAKGSKQAGGLLPLSYADFQDYASRQTAFSGMSAFTPILAMTLERATGPQRVFGELVTGSYFEALGISPAAGRFFSRDETAVGASAPVAVISYNAWKGKFGGAGDVVGHTLEINNVAVTVIGVAPPGFLGVSAIFGPDLWLPSALCEQLFPAEFHNALTDRSKTVFHVVARLKAGVARSQAQTSLEPLAAALRNTYPEADEARTVTVRPITDELYWGAGGGSSIVLSSVVLLVIVALVLAIACSNVASLLLARAAARRHEIAVRLAVGASRGRLVRQSLTESILLSLLSCAAGLGIGYAGCRLLWSFSPPEVAQNLLEPKLDQTVFTLAFLVSLVTAFAFGLMPALRSSKADVLDALKEDTRGAGRGRRAVSFSNLVLVGQIAFSFVSLVTAALFLRGVQRAYNMDPGFQTQHLAVFMMNPGQTGYGEARTKDFYRTIQERVSTLPGVASASWAYNMPFWASASRAISIERREPRKKSETITTIVNTVDTNYFETMAIPVVRGRVFTDADRDGTLPAAVINQELAEKYWPGREALGHRFLLAGDKTPRQVIGIVRTTNYTTLGEKAQPCVYLPLRQNFSNGMTLYVRSKADPGGILAGVQAKIRRFDPNVEVSDVRTGPKMIGQVLWAPRIAVALLGVFGSLALALASVGLYGVMAYSVNRRRREIGLRMALGASRGRVLGHVLRNGLTLVWIGVGVGLGASLLLGRALSRMLFGISSTDLISLAGASLVLILVAFVACYFPARAAARVDPMVALRDI
ncbi:MAG: ABC transporter permease [Acidobacteriaceae bacterium]|nr:ABC transporter permease [Acidobacteriaceae bacterium]